MKKVNQLYEILKKTVLIIVKFFIIPWPYFFIFLIAIGFISSVIPIIKINVIKNIVDMLSGNLGVNSAPVDFSKVFNQFFLFAFAFSLTLLIEFVLQSRSFLNYFSINLEENIIRKYHIQFFKKATSLKLEIFENQDYYNKVEHIRNTFQKRFIPALLGIQRIITIGIIMLVIIIELFKAHWAFPLLLIPGTYLISRLRVMFYYDYWKLNHEQTPLLRRLTYWSNLLVKKESAAEIRLFKLGNHFIDTCKMLMAQRRKEFYQRTSALLIKEIPLQLVLSSLGISAFILLLYVGLKGSLDVGKFIALLYMVQQYENNIDSLSQRFDHILKLALDFNVIQDFFAMKGEERLTGVPAPRITKDGISLVDVSYKYPRSDQEVLKSIHLVIKTGEKIAIVGENGAGKTTLIKLILGLYEPTQGQIMIENIPLKEINIATWRRQIGAVFQDFMQYSFSVEENISIGDISKAGMPEKIKLAAEQSGIDALIENLPQKYETLLGKEFKGATDFSKGQWQKLAITRAYFRDADIIVLDEPTSAIDPITELDIYKEFFELSANKTAIMISHRLASVQFVDRIIFMKEGEIIEEGSHQDLMKKNGFYANLFKVQAEWYKQG